MRLASVLALQGRGAEAELRDLEVEPVLREVDVAAAARRPPLRRLVERGIREGEARVQPEHAADAGMLAGALDEAQVLDQACDRLVAAVAVGDLVAEDRRQAGLGHRIGDQLETAAQAGGRGVVVEDRGAAPADAVGGAE